MSELKLYRVAAGGSAAERDLQEIAEANMEAFFGARLLGSEFSTRPVHGGRMDSIGIEEDGTPVIFVYKRNLSESVINQGLFHLDGLLELDEGLSRDVTNIGPLGNGTLELTVTSADAVAKALPLIQSGYEAN